MAAPTQSDQITARTAKTRLPGRSFLASVSCFFSCSALLLIVGAAPISVLAALLGTIGGIVSWMRIRSAPVEPPGGGMAIVATMIGAVTLTLALFVMLTTQAS
jgi:hypothetical protein